MSVKAEAEVFRRIPLFAGCEPAHLQMIAFSAERIEIPKGKFIIKQGNKGAAAFLILQGKAEASVEEEGDTRPRPVASLHPGSFVGELAMIADLPYSLSVKASEKVSAVRIPRSLFMRVASEFPEFGEKVHAALSNKLDVSVSELRQVQALFDQQSSG